MCIDNKSEFDHPPSSDEILSAYQAASESDPSSIHYKRVNVRPNLHFLRVLLCVFTALVIAGGIGWLVFLVGRSTLWGWLAFSLILLMVILAFLKQITVWFIKVYQRFAPDRVRNRCRFEPSCSQYMILAIEKYGFLIGVRKGVKRLRACRPPNGGIDLP